MQVFTGSAPFLWPNLQSVIRREQTCISVLTLSLNDSRFLLCQFYEVPIGACELFVIIYSHVIVGHYTVIVSLHSVIVFIASVLWSVRLATLLSKFRIEYSSMTVIPDMGTQPSAAR